MKLPVGMKEVFSDPHLTDEENTPTIKGNIWLMKISKAVLEKVCQSNDENRYWLQDK